MILSLRRSSFITVALLLLTVTSLSPTVASSLFHRHQNDVLRNTKSFVFDPTITTTDHHHTVLRRRSSQSSQTTTSRRQLQTVPIPPTRQCGQDLGVTPREVISSLVSLLARGLGNATTSTALGGTIVYDVRAYVLCGSCETTVATTSEMLTDTDVLGFGYYCREGGHGYNATHSALLLVPLDRDTGEVIANKKLKGSIFNHALTIDTSMAPSEIFPTDVAAFVQNNAENPAIAIATLSQVLAGLFATSTGVVSITPDYIGFGQSSYLTKSMNPKLYRQATIPLWLKAQTMVANMTGGCTELDNVVTVGGYSEGGFASFAISQALDRMGVTILSCNSGAAAWNLQSWLQWHLNDFDGGNVNPTIGVIMAYVGSAASSTDPDLANSNVGQDMIIDEWMDETNFSRWAKGWISSDLSPEEAASYVPLPDYVQILNPNITSMFRNATAMNSSDPCSFAIVGETDKYCEVLEETDLSDDIISPRFPVVLCHSPDDEVIPYDVHFPDVSASPNLTEFSLLGQGASGSHGEAFLFCLIPIILPFTEFDSGAAIEQVPLDTCVASPTTEPTPTASPPTPTVAPVTSRGSRSSVSVLPVFMASCVWLLN